jgi:hypothetical protein
VDRQGAAGRLREVVVAHQAAARSREDGEVADRLIVRVLDRDPGEFAVLFRDDEGGVERADDPALM